ncbi:MAG: acetyltransferase [Actinomycetia bacterium]|nr:acetyltransferase [Actinomycetes bacterium]
MPKPLELCEDFVLHVPPRRDIGTVLGVGFACVPRGPGGAVVQHIRLADAGEVHRAVEQVRTIARAAGQTRAVWWVGEFSTPDDVVDWLAAEGLVPDEDEPLLASLVLHETPRGVAPNLEVTRVCTFDDFLLAQEIDLITMGVAPEERSSMLERSRAQWDTVDEEGIVQTYLGRVDGRAVAFARSAYGTDGVALLGGGTLEADRGNGYYTALVHARWQDAVERGTPLLCTQAGKMSQPILERLGFERLGAIRLLVDRL